MAKAEWYAVRTMPGAQLPQREYITEPTSIGKGGRPRGKGYRLVPSLNPNVSAIERALTQAGFRCFMPVSKRMVRDRRKLGVWKSRRFPLIQGYIFVADVEDWPKLCATTGVAGVVGTCGTPLPIDQKDIDDLAEEEARAEEAFQNEVKRREAEDALRARKITRRALGKTYRPGSMVGITKGIAAGRTATISGVDRGGRLKAMLDGVGTISISPDDVSLLAAE